MQPQLLLVHEVLKSILGGNLKAVVAYGSMTRPADAAPVSELNLAILVREKIPSDLRGRIAELLGSNVSTLVIDLESFLQMVRDGEYLAHEILRAGKVLYSDAEFEKLLSESPPISKRTVDYLRSHALACLALSIENLLAGRYMWSINYAYKSVRSAARFSAALRGSLPFTDDEVLEALRPLREVAPVYARVREARKAGVREGELHELLASCYNAVITLLGYEPVDWWGALQGVKALFVSDVKLEERGGLLSLVLRGVDADKQSFTVTVPLQSVKRV